MVVTLRDKYGWGYRTSGSFVVRRGYLRHVSLPAEQRVKMNLDQSVPLNNTPLLAQ